MKWSYVAGVALSVLVLILIPLRAERRRWWVVALLFDLPVAYLAIQWIDWRRAWNEAYLGLALGAAAGLAWWFFRGRHLPPVTTDSIKVWGQEPVPKPRPGEFADLQAEVARLREEKEKMEAELRRLKGPTQDK